MFTQSRDELFTNEKDCFSLNVLALTKRPFWIEKNSPIEHHCSHYTESWTYSTMTYAATNFSWKMNKRSETQRKNLKKKSPSKDSHDQPFNDMHLHDPLQLAMGASLNEHMHATPAAFSCTCIHDIVFSPRKRKSLLSLPFADRVPLISNGECALQAGA